MTRVFSFLFEEILDPHVTENRLNSAAEVLVLEKAFDGREEHGGFGASLTHVFEHADIPLVSVNRQALWQWRIAPSAPAAASR